MRRCTAIEALTGMRYAILVSALLHVAVFLLLTSEFAQRTEPPAEPVIPIDLVLLDEPEAEPEIATEEPMPDPEPAATAAEPETAPEPEIAAEEPEPAPEPEPEIAAEEPEPAPEPEPEIAAEEPVTAPEPEPEVATEEPEPASEPEPEIAAEEPGPAPEAKPEIAAQEPAPVPDVEPEIAAEEPATAAVEESTVAIDLPLPPIPLTRPDFAVTPDTPPTPPVEAEAIEPAPTAEIADAPAAPPPDPEAVMARQPLTPPATAQQLLANLAAVQDEDAQARVNPKLWAVIRAIRAQIKECWLLNPDETRNPRLSVEIAVAFDQNGGLTKAKVQDIGRMVTDDAFKDFATSAHRALTACSPFELPAEQYAIWQSFTMRFVPREPS